MYNGQFTGETENPYDYVYLYQYIFFPQLTVHA